MILFNGAGVVIVICTGLLSWGICVLLSGGAMVFGLLWVGLVGSAAVVYDRLDPREGFKAYWRWLNMGAESHSRVAGFGAPLLFVPLLVLAGAVIFPKIKGGPMPPAEFLLGTGIIAVLTIVGGIIAHGIRCRHESSTKGDAHPPDFSE